MHVPHKTLSDRGRKKFVNFETTIAYKKGPCGMCCVCNPPFENPGYGPAAGKKLIAQKKRGSNELSPANHARSTPAAIYAVDDLRAHDTYMQLMT